MGYGIGVPKVIGTRPKPHVTTPRPAKPSAPPAKPLSPSTGGPGDGLDTGGTDRAWATFRDAGGQVTGARIQSFSSPMQNAGGRVVFDWDKPGDTIPFEMTVEVNGDRSKVRPEVWTNANHNADPQKYEAVLMREVKVQGNQVTYRADLPITNIGNYRATGRISVDGGSSYRWTGDAGMADLRFRPRVEAHDALNLMEVNVLSVNGGHGTFADLMGPGSPQTDGKYTLEAMAKEGVNAVWVMPPFKRSVWDYRNPADDAGSPYATKNFFQVDPEYSAKAKELRAQGKSETEVEAAANAEFKAFVDQAHKLGLKVVVDVALNHVGHNYEFSDLFTRYDAAGKEIREVLKDNYSQVVVNPEQKAVVDQHLADPSVPKYMEYVAPWMYASRTGNKAGAQSAADAMAGGGQWFDTKQLYTGGWYGGQNKDQNAAVVGYLGRVLEYWSVDMGVDGFRLDHLTGLPQTVMEDSLNHAQAAVDQHRPGTQLYFTGEDFFSAEYNIPYLDNIQDTWLRNSLVASTSPGTLRGLLQNPYFNDREMLNLDSHDEERFPYHGDTNAAARLSSLLPLLGGATFAVAGDELGESNGMPFKQYRPVDAIEHPSDAGKYIASVFAKAGAARKALPALQDDNRGFPTPREGGDDPDLFAMTRFPDSKRGGLAIVFANFNNSRDRENAFALDDAARSRIDPDKRYQVRDLMGDGKPLWREPLTGRELLDKGIFARLSPYQVQVLSLEAVP